ncbi:hypothetical protein HYV83_05795 [Candidatus Woesearchaeota archaeon]|nr:hypothetical protein [Candidatus Woesearchaeota archaeon]
MGNNLTTVFIYENGKSTKVAEFDEAFLRNLIKAAAADIYPEGKILETCKTLLCSKLPTGERGGTIEVSVDGIYWFGISVFEHEGVYVSLYVEDSYLFNVLAMEDFAMRVKAAYELLKPWHGYADLSDGLVNAGSKFKHDIMPFAHVFWLNFYSHKLVKEIGKVRILAAVNSLKKQLSESVSAGELADGGLVLKAGETPGDVSSHARIEEGLEKELFGKLCGYHHVA